MAKNVIRKSIRDVKTTHNTLNIKEIMFENGASVRE